MRRSHPILTVTVLVLTAATLLCMPEAEAQDLRPVTVGSPMPDFTLPAYQGGEVAENNKIGQARRVIARLPDFGNCVRSNDLNPTERIGTVTCSLLVPPPCH